MPTLVPVLLAGGIGTALVTTFWGLIVAIPALSGYAVLRGRLDATLAPANNTHRRASPPPQRHPNR